MSSYKFYKKEGNQYIFKNQPVFITVLSILLLAFAAFIFNNVRILSLIVIATVVLIIINFFTKKFIIDMDRKTITGKHTIFVPSKTYNIQDFTNFDVLSTKYLGLFTTNVILSIYFEVDGKEKHLTIGQALNQRGIQKMVNETEDIMNINEPGNERNRPV
ncbi:hypothetical protein EG359_19410 [Chryseobacterium joostei]|uniref:PH domain-containing protein n=1 Tax=Chryseobacterium joostei TaxID=112234 RepID=A0A1N7J3H9_9FLAO|nr:MULTISPECIES: hypothetical protein [Chryseobacterium]AZB01638.1 hypothetical protein EG359_19410 [Chryseobacterium joostei]SIS43900.1 hypothetical protein SAMN05421768_107254 [Chryseobacterium joostei]HCM34339.1 hypothetical protein [Chryseobacterium sp.]